MVRSTPEQKRKKSFSWFIRDAFYRIVTIGLQFSLNDAPLNPEENINSISC
jgi:hypothetical protein